jgi:hypothetical protein
MPEVSIIPNPCSQVAGFFAGTSVPLHYEITNQMGQVLIQSSFSVSVSVDISSLPAGIYFVNFMYPASSFRLTKKLLKY